MADQKAIIPNNRDDIQAIIQLALDSLTSQHSRTAYQKALNDFLTWYTSQGNPGLTKATVQAYRAVLQGQGYSPSTINLRMSAIRKLAAEAADNGLVDQAIANGIANVRGVKQQGVRAGNWLTREQAQALINSPDTTTLKGLRDRAILAVMIGAGLRRSEVAALTFDHIQQREGRWVIVDIVGKGNRVRTVPIPGWCKAVIDAWTHAAGLVNGRVFRATERYGRSLDRHSQGITPQAVQDVVKDAARGLGRNFSAHDLRRTFSKLAHKGGAAMEQIQLSLGHASIKTTERYLGVTQDLNDAPADHLGLRLE